MHQADCAVPKPRATPRITRRTTRTSSFPINTRKSSRNSANLDGIKRQLLKETDWAAVSAARPLKMTFTPLEELERFGKRRRLTDADRRRLASSNTRLFTPEFTIPRARQREDTVSEAGAVGDMDIRINAHRSDARLIKKGSQGVSLNNESSQPMLLDREESEHPAQDSGAKTSWSRTNRRRTSSRSSCSLLTSDKASACSNYSKRASSQFLYPASESPAISPSSRNRSTETCIDGYSTGYRQYSERSSGCRSESRFHDFPFQQQAQYIPTQRRFTIDDQVLAEKEGMLNISSDVLGQRSTTTTTTQHTSPPQKQDQVVPNRHRMDYIPLENKSKSGLQVLTTDMQSSSSTTNQFSSWLPEPRYHIQRSLKPERKPKLATGSGSGSWVSSFPNKLSRSQYHENPTSSPADRASVGRQSTSPIKIYGQSIVFLDDDNRVVEQKQSQQPPREITKSDLENRHESDYRTGLLLNRQSRNQFQSNMMISSEEDIH